MSIKYENFININGKLQTIGIFQNPKIMDGSPIYIYKDCIAHYYIEDGHDTFVSIKQDKYVSDIDIEFIKNNNIKQIVLRPNKDTETIILPNSNNIDKESLDKTIAANAMRIAISISGNDITIEYKYKYITEEDQTSENLRFLCIVYHK